MNAFFSEELLVSAFKRAFTELQSESAVASVTFHEYVKEKYWPYFLSKKRSDAAIDAEKLRINVLLSIIPLNWKLTAITENDLEVVLNKVSKRRTAKGFISSATVNRYRSRLLAIFNHAIREGILLKNPVRSYRKAKETPRKRVLSSDEFNRFLDACKVSKNKELYDVMAIAYYSGMRLGEIQGLVVSNIKFEQNHIVLNEWQTKAGRVRTIPIHPFISGILKERVLGAKDNGGEKLFTFYSIRRAIENAIKRAGLTDFMCRDLRRTFATRLKNNNANVHTISSLLGHSSIAMTEKYLGLDLGVLEKAVATLE
ncbi:MAG: site-specific integrase [Deferribacteraceae bacterium]|jgi:integrase|nr:site-specific integrase [Deferribacteraceae bacterium]